MRVRQLLRTNIIFALVFSAKVEYGWVFYTLLCPLLIVASQHQHLDFTPPAWWVAMVWLTLTALGTFLLTNTCLKIVRDAKQLRLPSSVKHVIVAHAIGISALIVIPCSLVTIISHAQPIAAFIEFFGLLGITTPLIALSRPWILGLNVRTLLFALPLGIATIVGIYKSIAHIEYALLYLSPSFLLLAGLALWHWQVEFTSINPRASIFQLAADRSTGINHQSLTDKAPRYSAIPVSQYSRSSTAVIRVFLGKPLAPMSWYEHLTYAGSLVLMALMPPFLMAVVANDVSINGLAKQWNTIWPFSLYATSLLTWILYMKPVTDALKANGLRISELALMPGLGNKRKLLLSFLNALFGRIAWITLLLLCIAEVSLYQRAKYWQPEFNPIPGLTLAVAVMGMFATHCTGLIQGIAGTRFMNTPEKRRQQLINALWVFPLSQDWMWLSLFVTTAIVDIDPFFSIVKWLLPAILMLTPIIFLWMFLNLSRRPHPFVEISG